MCNTASNSIQGFTSVPAADRSALPAMPSVPTRVAMKPAGVGIVFQREENLEHGGLVVDSVAHNGPADMSGMVSQGDRLITINGTSIKGLDAKGIARLILGPMGSAVELEFVCCQASDAEAEPETKKVTLVRGFTPLQP